MTAPAYSNDLYDTIAAFGVRRGAAVLSAGDERAGTPFEQNGFSVTTFAGIADALPYPDERFDLVLNAQQIQSTDRMRFLLEAHRVLRRGGILAVWWKKLMSQDGVKEIRDEAFAATGVPAPPEGLSGGFKEFYAAEQFVDQTLRVVPWRTAMMLDDFAAAEREDERLQAALGPKLQTYVTELQRRVRERLGASNPNLGLAYVQYVYLARKP